METISRAFNAGLGATVFPYLQKQDSFSKAQEVLTCCLILHDFHGKSGITGDKSVSF